MRSTTQETLTHGNKCGEVCDGVGGKVMKLCSKKVQKTPEKRMRRQEKTTVDVGREEDALTLLRPRLGLITWQPPGSMGNQAPLDQILQILLPNHGSNPVALDPAG
jgi:hypothetical protein